MSSAASVILVEVKMLGSTKTFFFQLKLFFFQLKLDFDKTGFEQVLSKTCKMHDMWKLFWKRRVFREGHLIRDTAPISACSKAFFEFLGCSWDI